MTAADVNVTRLRVGHDFTDLAISLCRGLYIPARHGFGHLPDIDVPVDGTPMDFAAWRQVWLGDRWSTFDPRSNRRRRGRIHGAPCLWHPA